MPLRQDEYEKALRTGLKMFGSDQVMTPNAWNQDLAYLQNLFVALLTGNMKVVDVQPSVVPIEKPKDPDAISQ